MRLTAQKASNPWDLYNSKTTQPLDQNLMCAFFLLVHFFQEFICYVSDFRYNIDYLIFVLFFYILIIILFICLYLDFIYL